MSLARPPRPTLLAALRSPCRAAWLSALALLGSSAAQSQQPFDVALRDGLLSIRANGASVTELAAALADETGIRFVITGDGGTPITAEIVDEPFVKAVAKLSPNHLLVRDGESDDSPVTEVVLMLDDTSDGGAGGGDGFLPSGAPADEVVGDDSGVPLDQSLEQPLDQPLMDDGITPVEGSMVPADGGFVEGVDPQGVDPGYQDGTLAPDGTLPSQ